MNQKNDGWTGLGEALVDYLNGDLDAQIRVKWDTGDTQRMPISHFFRSGADLPPVERKALELCQGRILDVGAGAGTHSLALQELGLEVTAVDILPLAVEVMKRRGVRNPLEGDYFQLNLPKFDTILMMMNGLGFVEEVGGLDKLLEKAEELLVPGGMILADSTDLVVSLDLDEDADLQDPYIGETAYTVTYKGRESPKQKWLFVDPEILAFRAASRGWTGELVLYEPDGHYLIKLIAPLEKEQEPDEESS